MINRFIIAASAALMFVALSGCSSETETPRAPQTTGLQMKVARDFWPGQFWVDIADQKGWFKEAGLNVKLVDVTDNFLPSVQAWVDGKMDVNQPVLFDLIKYNAKGADLVAVTVSDLSYDADGIVAKKEIENISDLKGKRIGLERGTFTEFLLSIVLERSGMTLDDVELVQNQSKVIQPFIDGKLDALVTWEPYLTQATEQGDGHRVFGTAEIPGLISDVIGFHRGFIEERPGDVQAFVNVWHKTTQFIKENPKEAFGIIAQIYKQTPGEVQAFAQVDRILDLRDNITAFSFGSGFESLHGTVRRINDFLIEKGIIKELLDSTEILDARFIQALKKTSS